MKAINVGDVYFLTSLFKGDMDKEVEKKVSFLLGTISPRPVVIIREPFPWDKYGEVTVLPAMSHGNASITCQAINRVGGWSDHDYKFVPHAPSRVPVTRLGRYIGKLSNEELEDILYAFHWIHDPTMQNDSRYDIPPVYKELFEKLDDYRKAPLAITRDGFTITDNLTLKTSSGDKPIDLSLNLNTASIEAMVPIDSRSKENLNAVRNILDKKNQETPYKAIHPEVKSLLPQQIVDKYYDTYITSDVDVTVPARKATVISPDEIEVMRGDLSLLDFQLMLDQYRNLSAYDREYFMIWLSNDVLNKNITAISAKQIAVLKRICDFMRGMPEEDYEARLKITYKSEPESVIEDEKRLFQKTYPIFTQDNEIATAVKTVKPWLSEERMSKMPKTKQRYFVRIPMIELIGNTSIPNFRYYYYVAYAKYRRILINDLKQKGKR